MRCGVWKKDESKIFLHENWEDGASKNWDKTIVWGRF